MKFFRKLGSRFRKGKLDADMTEEMGLHLERRTEENIASGMTPDEARYAAMRRFGGVEQVKEIVRDQRGFLWLEQLWQDVRHGARGLRKNPGFALVAILTLALGIGANTALFTFVNALMVRSLPVADPGRLVQLQSIGGDESFSYASYERFLDQAHTLQGLALSRRGVNRQELVGTGFGAVEAESVRAQMVSGNYFSVLGAQAALGRVFTVGDEHANQTQAVLVLSHAYWQRRFGGDASVIGRTVQMENVPFTIVGVMPAGFTGFELGINPEVWWPLHAFSQVENDPRSLERLRDEGWEWALILGRLAAGVTREQARAELQTIFQRQRVAFAAERPKWTDKQRREYLARTIELLPGGSGYTSLRQQLARPLSILGVIVGLVLLIACANLAGLLLARGAARQRELAVRVALGAGRGRLVRQLLTESLVLAFVGGLGGILLAHWGTAFLAGYLPQRNATIDLRPDGIVLVFAFALSALAGVLFGLLPALRLGETALMSATKTFPTGTRSRLNRALVVAQIALSVALLAGAGLFVRSLQKLKSTDLGFRPENLVGFRLEFSRNHNARQRADVHKRLLESLSALPDVRSATVSGAGLFSGEGFGIRVGPEGYTPQQDEDMRALVVVAGPRFFSTFGIPLRAGREFTAADELLSTTPMASAVAAAPASPNSPRIAIVGESFALRFFGTTNVVGRTVRFGLNNQQPPLEIVGVAADIKYRTVREKPEMQLYVPYFGGVMNVPMTTRVATRTEPLALAANVRALVKQIDPRIDVADMRLMSDVIDESLTRERVVAELGGFFSVFALTLACLGLYGVLSYSVVQRTREIGVRMALGARTADVLRLVVGQGVKLALVGTLAGVVLAFATTHFVTRLLYGVTPVDPITFIGVAVLLLVVATVAAWVPALRAARIQPIEALRTE